MFSNVVQPVIFITSNTKCCKFYDERVQEKDKRVRQKDDSISFGFDTNVWYHRIIGYLCFA